MQLRDDVVRELMLYTLYRPEEVPDKVPPKDAVIVEGIVSQFGFHPGRLQEKKEVVRSLLEELPDAFMKGKGEGMSFLSMCEDRHGNLWGQHRACEDLLCLGIGLGMVHYNLPKSEWRYLPGGVPYIVIDTEVP